MTIGVLIVEAAIGSSFGEQSMLTSTARAKEVATAAAAQLDAVSSLGREDFNLVYASSSETEFSLQQSAELQSDFVSKIVTERVSLPGYPGIYTEYSTRVVNLDNPDAPDTCDATMHGDWQHPLRADFDIRTLIGTTTGAYTISDVDAFKGVLYVAFESTTYKTDPTLISLDITDPLHPALLGALNTSSTTAGLAAVRATNSAGITRLYAANAGSFAKGQLQIINASDPAHLSYPQWYKVPLAYVPAAGNGRSIYYKDGYVYLGLTAAAGTTEFHVINVHDPAHPLWVGGYAFGSTVEAVQVKGTRAYLATDDNAREFFVLDVSNPASPYVLGTYDAPGSTGSGYGRSLFVRGTVAYFGRTWVLNSGVPEHAVLDVSHPGTIAAVATRDVGTSAHPYGVYGMLVRGERVFILTKSSAGGQVSIVPSEPLASYAAATPVVLDLPSGFGGTALDCERDALYIGSVDTAGNGMLTVVVGG